jgi:hypothetical protein
MGANSSTTTDSTTNLSYAANTAVNQHPHTASWSIKVNKLGTELTLLYISYILLNYKQNYHKIDNQFPVATIKKW